MVDRLSSDQQKVLSRIVSRLLNLRSGTPVTHLRKSLGPRRQFLDDMIGAKVLRLVGGQYLPTLRAIEYLDDEVVRRIVQDNLSCVLVALQHLYRGGSDQYTFDFESILQEARALDPSLDGNDLLPVLLLGEELGYYYFESGIREDGDRLAVDGVTVQERIMDFTSIEEDWAHSVTEQDRKAKEATQAVPSSGPSAGALAPASVLPNPNAHGFHPEIEKVSGRLYHDGHYKQAAFEAYIRVISEVRERSGLQEDGDRLVNRAFGCEKQVPVVQFNSLRSEPEQDEQRGLMFLYKGIVFLRNSKAHSNRPFNDPQRAHDYLTLASLLTRLLEIAQFNPVK